MKIKIGDYIIKRLKEFKVDHIFGVPGDYNFGLLDQIEDTEGIEWVGNCNELNAAYAADGYSRIRGMAAVVTTFGVGELSAINGIAGSYAENVPVVHIVGVPPIKTQESKAYVHHTLGDGEFKTFYKMFQEVTVAQASLTEMNAEEEINRVLKACYIHKKPVYIQLPVDVVNQEIEVNWNVIIEWDKINLKAKSNTKTLNKFITKAKEVISKSKSQFIIADYMATREGLKAELTKFVNVAKIPVSTLNMGKTAIDETNEYFAGIYAGKLSSAPIKEMINASDLAILIGVKFSDNTTAAFSYINYDMDRIEVLPHYCKIGKEYFGNIMMKDVLEALSISEIKFHNPIKVEKTTKAKFVANDATLKQDRFYEQIEDFLEEEDVVIGEQGTAFFGASGMSMPKGSSFIGEPLWGAIGHGVPALLGTQIADKNRRNILIEGDGSFQLTAQELSTMLKEDIKPIIFLINNNGYTIEDALHGQKRKYNIINMWDYTKLVDVFGLNCANKALKFKVTTEKELAEVMKSINSNKDKLSFVEVYMEKEDLPKIFAEISQIILSKSDN